MNHISINDKYYISFPELKMTDDLKDKNHYLKYPRSFMQRFTNLNNSDIEEILNDKELTETVINSVYDKLDITKESTFISKVNKAYSCFNKIDMIFFISLHYTFGIPMTDLIGKTTKELIMLFIINCQINRDDTSAIDRVCEGLKVYYSDETINDFKKLCVVEKTKEEQIKDWNEEFSQFSQL